MQNLSVAGYNGENDPSHMPLTFWIKLEDVGRAQPSVRTPFTVEGDVRCLADRYAVWDAGSGQWAESVHNFAAGPVAYNDAPQTNASGMVIVRLFLDYGRMRLFDMQLPCALDFTAYAPNEESAETFQKAETSLQILSPAFVRSVVYQVVTQEGAATRRQIFNVAQLRDWVAPLTPGEDKFGLNPTPYFEEPTQARVLSRVSLDGQPFSPPAAADYFVPIKPGARVGRRRVYAAAARGRRRLRAFVGAACG